MNPDQTRTDCEAVVRASYGKLLAVLIHRYGDLEMAEDCLQDALLRALDQWPKAGQPPNPEAWLYQTAKNRMVDRLRRDQNYRQKLDSADFLDSQMTSGDIQPEHEIPDERLRLIFTCCHPALESSVQVALTLQTLCGLSVQQVANAFLVTQPTMAQRLVRAKRKIISAAIPYQVPQGEAFSGRLENVLSVIYLIFNEGYYGTVEGELIDRTLCDEAIHLARMLVSLMSDEMEAWGLLALMLFHQSRYPARVDETGELIDLEHQNRDCWSRDLIETADHILSSVLIKGRTGPYQIQAAISAVHAHSPSFDDTDWKQICLLYRLLYREQPNPVVQLNLAVAISFAESVSLGLQQLESLAQNSELETYHPFHAARASLLFRDGQFERAVECYRRALACCHNQTEKKYLQRKIDEVSRRASD